MKNPRVDRRKFIKAITGSAAALSVVPADAAAVDLRSGAIRHETAQGPAEQKTAPRIRFAVIGINHSHINSQVTAVLRGGGELVALYAKEPDLTADFVKRFPQVKVARTENEILDDSTIQLVLSSAIPDERAPI